MKNEINVENSVKNGVALNYDLFKSEKENRKDHKGNTRKKQDWQEPKIEVVEISLSELDVDFSEILNIEFDIPEFAIPELDIEMKKILNINLNFLK